MNLRNRNKDVKDHKIQIKVAIISTVGVILAAIIGLIPIILSKSQTPTSTLVPTSTLALTSTFSPTNTVNPSSTPSNPLAAAKQWPVQFVDDFSGDNINQQWDVLYKSSDLITEIFDLTFRINVITEGMVRSVYYMRQNASIGEIFFLSMEGAADAQSGCYYGLLFRVTDDDNFYWFQIRHGNKYQLRRSINGDIINLIPEKDIPAGLSVKTLAVVGEGNHYRLYINDDLVDEFIDETLNGPYVGVATTTCQYLEKAEYTFDNFEIRSPKNTTAKEITIDANKVWQNSQIELTKGDEVSIIYKGGEWYVNPADATLTDAGGYNSEYVSIVSNAHYGALLTKVGNLGNPFEAGNQISFTAQETGILQFQINDGILDDNAGSVTVIVSISR